MSDFDSDAARAYALFQQAKALGAKGRTDEELYVQQQALAIERDLTARQPDNTDHLHMIAALLYNMASDFIALGRPAEAVEALNECEQTYMRLSAVLDTPPLIADVHARRGLAQKDRRYGASAILELDRAVMQYIALGATDSDSPYYLDLARVLSLNAVVLSEFGDPDLAVVSADQSMRMFLAKGEEINRRGKQNMHAGYLKNAAVVASTIHGQRGRTDIALMADGFAVDVASFFAEGGSPSRQGELASALARQGLHLAAAGREAEANAALEKAERLYPTIVERAKAQLARPLVTLADALQQTNKAPDTLNNLVFDVTTTEDKFCPSTRCDPLLALLYALSLSELAMEMLGDAPEYGARLGLEAHCLFVVASGSGDLNMRYQFQTFGKPWASLLMALAQACMEAEAWDMARDFSEWLEVVTAQLAPLAEVDADMKDFVPRCQAFMEQVEAKSKQAEANTENPDAGATAKDNA